MISTKNGQKGRFGNKFIRNMIIYLVSNKLNIETKYENDIENNIDYFLKLGFKFTSKDNNELKKQKITSSQIIDILNNKITYLPEKHYILDGFYQNPEIIKHINYYFTNKNNFYVQRVILNNPYQNRYKNNKDIFIHLRAGDIFSYNKNNMVPSLSYYTKILDKFKDQCDNIYLSSDNIDCHFCQTLINTYKIKKYNKDKVDTIQFASTCKYIILSSGSYSLIIGLLSFFTETVFYDENIGKLLKNNKMIEWHPNFLRDIEYNIFNI